MDARDLPGFAAPAELIARPGEPVAPKVVAAGWWIMFRLRTSSLLTVFVVSAAAVASQPLISTVAGTGGSGSVGNGGPATAATLSPHDLAVDSEGNIYVAEGAGIRRFRPGGVITAVTGSAPVSAASIDVDSNGNMYVAGAYRIQKITPDGVVTSIAGTGTEGYTGDNGPAISAQIGYVMGGLSVDRAGNVYFADFSSNTVRRVSATGIITTVAGTGTYGYGNDGVPANRAPLAGPTSVTSDAAGVLYITDSWSSRVRRVGLDGIVTTIAGNGRPAFDGDGGPANIADLNYPTDVALDGAGGIYIADFGNHRVRYIDPKGIITTIAGTGVPGYAGDGGPADKAQLNYPISVVLDGSGNLYIADSHNNRVRMVSFGGSVTAQMQIENASPLSTCIAGTTYSAGFSVSGGTAPYSWSINAGALPGALSLTTTGTISGTCLDVGTFGFTAQVKDAAGTSASKQFSIDVAASATLRISPDTLLFESVTGGSTTAAQTVTIASSAAGIPTSISVTTQDGRPWLRAAQTVANTPAQLTVTASPEGLDAGSYQGTIVISGTGTTPATQRIQVSFQIQQPASQAVQLEPDQMTFTFLEAAAADSRALQVAVNSESVNLSATASTRDGGNWLTASPRSPTVSAGNPGLVTVRADPSGLAPGTYSGRVSIGDQSVPVLMTINAPAPRLELPKRGLVFTATSGGTLKQIQNLPILNTGAGPLMWQAAASTLSGGDWLQIAPAAGTVPSSGASAASITIDPTGLAAGSYYGQVTVSRTDTAESAQLATIVLNVVTAETPPQPAVAPTGLLFTGIVGGTNPASQQLAVQNVGSAVVRFISRKSTADNVDWFTYAPASGNVAAGGSLDISVQAHIEGLAAGVREGYLTFQFSDGTVRAVRVVLVLPAVQGKASQAVDRHHRNAVQSCTPKRLVAVFTSLFDNFSAPAAWPVSVELVAVDDCAQPLTAGAAVVSFSNSDPPLPLAALGNGHWAGTWAPRITTRAVELTAVTRSSDGKLEGRTSIRGAVQKNPDASAGDCTRRSNECGQLRGRGSTGARRNRVGIRGQFGDRTESGRCASSAHGNRRHTSGCGRPSVTSDFHQRTTDQCGDPI